MDYYKLLGISKNASQDEIKAAWRRQASIHHPDKGGNTATFQQIQTAYEVLGDEAKRQEYDNPAPQQFHGFPGGFSFNTSSGFNDIFEMFANQHRQPRQPQQQTYRTIVVVTLEQVYSGEEQVLRLQTPTNTHAVKVHIPKGIHDGAQMRIDNAVDGASLIVEFRISPHLRFERNGNDLYANHPISVLDLITGTTFEFTTLSGKTLEVTVKPRTQPYMQLKISGQGMPITNTMGYGDQILLFKPYIPDIIDEAIINSILESTRKGK